MRAARQGTAWFAVLAMVVGCTTANDQPKQAPAAVQEATPQAPPSRASSWEITEDRSPMDDSPTITLRTEAALAVEGWPERKLPPVLIVRCKEHKTDVYVVTGRAANPELGKYDEYGVTVRLDRAQPTSEDWGQSTDSDALFAPEPVSMARRLAKADTFRFRFTPYDGSPTILTFATTGLSTYLPRIAKACGWDISNMITDQRQIAVNREMMSQVVGEVVGFERYGSAGDGAGRVGIRWRQDLQSGRSCYSHRQG